MKKILILFLIVLILGCQKPQPPSNPTSNHWQDTELKDVNSEKTFKISDFRGKPVILESFAVWCPTCTKQQIELKKFHEEVGDDVISISLDTDPNEDEQVVKEHSQKNNFNWYYVVSPPEFTQTLINEFGIKIVNAPSVPIILICEDGSYRFLQSGIKTKDDLKQAIKEGC